MGELRFYALDGLFLQNDVKDGFCGESLFSLPTNHLRLGIRQDIRKVLLLVQEVRVHFGIDGRIV